MDFSLPDELVLALEAEEAEELGKIIRAHREDHFQSLRKLLSPGPGINEEYRRKALYALGQWGDPRVIPDIVRVLPELGERGRIAAIGALGQLGAQEALPAITSYEDDPSPQVRKFVVEALSQIGGPAAQARLRVIAEKDPEEWIRHLTIQRMEKR